MLLFVLKPYIIIISIFYVLYIMYYKYNFDNTINSRKIEYIRKTSFR